MKNTFFMTLLGSSVIVWGWYLLLCPSGIRASEQLRTDVAAQQFRVERWKRKEKRLSEMLARGEKTPFLLEKCAREKLQFIGDGEVMHLLSAR